jgi:hypothetical protein
VARSTVELLKRMAASDKPWGSSAAASVQARLSERSSCSCLTSALRLSIRSGVCDDIPKTPAPPGMEECGVPSSSLMLGTMSEHVMGTVAGARETHGFVPKRERAGATDPRSGLFERSSVVRQTAPAPVFVIVRPRLCRSVERIVRMVWSLALPGAR